MRLSRDYGWNILHISARLRVAESFDIIERHLATAEGEVTFEGENLCVNCLSGELAAVSGRILLVSFA